MQWLQAFFPSSIPRLTVLGVVDVVVVAFLLYQTLLIIRGRRAAHIVGGILILCSLYVAASYLGLELIRTVLASVAPYVPFAMVVMFQSEIRRLLARIGRRRWFNIGNRLLEREFAEELVAALKQLASQKTGALVVVERDIGLRTFIESGVTLDSQVSRDLLLTIFMNGSALHDGAVIIQGQRIAAAACFLPLTTKPALARNLGTRHRAAIGVTEETDCLSLVVSEETGSLSVAAFGEIELGVTDKRLQERIADHIIHRRGAPAFQGEEEEERESAPDDGFERSARDVTAE